MTGHIIPAYDGKAPAEARLSGPPLAPCYRPHLHPGDRHPGAEPWCYETAHHNAGAAPAPRHTTLVEADPLPALPETDDAGMSWAAELRDAQAITDHRGRDLADARANLAAALEWVTDARNGLTAAVGVLAEVKARRPVPEPVPEPAATVTVPKLRWAIAERYAKSAPGELRVKRALGELLDMIDGSDPR